MKIFLIIMASWDFVFQGELVTPSIRKEAPNMATCQAIAKTLISYNRNVKADCIQSPR